jgi:phosphohistidine swiveling domain-containing protein
MLAAPASASQRWSVDIAEATDPAACGGKAVGLARLKQAGWAVPPAICITTDFYRRWLEVSGLARRLRGAVAAAGSAVTCHEILGDVRARIEATPLPDDLDEVLRDNVARLADADGALSVRSSGVYEDDRDASHAGIHTSAVVAGDDACAVVAAVKTCWASLWTEAAWTYRQRHAIPHEAAAMAVVIQRFVAASVSGVAFSVDPMTGDRTTVVIEAVRGAGAALVGGQATPDHYRVAVNTLGPAEVRRRDGRSGPSVLSDEQVMELAVAAKGLERALGAPVDLEWVFDGRAFWAVQARPITTLAPTVRPTARRPTLWTRANLKEVFPELPSPLALSYLGISLNRMFRAYHTANGYALPRGAELVSVISGRPYLNLSLMQDLAIERGGDPAVVGRLFGGGSTPPRSPAPAAPPKLPLAGYARLAREMLTTFFRTPARGRRLFRIMRAEAALLRSVPLGSLDDPTLVAHFECFGATLLHERALRQLHEVVSAQSRAYMVLEALVTAWIPNGEDGIMTRLMTGLGTLPNVRMTYGLMDLGMLAAQDGRARAYFMGELDDAALRDYERALAGTAVLAGLQEFLGDFGHRGSYESDVMSARFAEDPTPLLRMIQLHVRAGATETAAAHTASRRELQRAAMTKIRQTLRAARGPLGFSLRWSVFSMVCSAVRRLLALRDECRHVTTMLVTHLRRVALEMGRRAARAGRLADSTDVFFLTWDEMPRLLREGDTDWAAVAAQRRRQRERDAEEVAPDLVSDDGTAGRREASTEARADADELIGHGVSPGVVSGRVRVLRSMEDIGRLSGEIVVFPSIEPTLAPIFPLVHGLVAEMGGLLSHAAILAREYGLPAIVNVPDATRRLRDGDRVELDGTSGRIRVLERATSA